MSYAQFVSKSFSRYPDAFVGIEISLRTPDSFKELENTQRVVSLLPNKSKGNDDPTNIPSGNEDVKPVETQSRKIDSELPDFPEYPFIREDFVSGIRNRDYLKTLPKEKRIDLLSKKSGDIVYFDDEEFKHYFPHE